MREHEEKDAGKWAQAAAEWALAEKGNNVDQAATLLGVSDQTLSKWRLGKVRRVRTETRRRVDAIMPKAEPEVASGDLRTILQSKMRSVRAELEATESKAACLHGKLAMLEQLLKSEEGG